MIWSEVPLPSPIQMVSQPNDRGSVTAEFALALPALALVMSVTIGGLGLQMERINLVSLAATASRALARGEDPAQLIEAFDQSGVRIEPSEAGELLCMTAYKEVKLVNLPESMFSLSETQCARRNGL
ncbi:hypothetical protein [Rhodoluna limnophila]|uniref:hypothetical protein n=1 Tax=Rhodoluna limnophila TaxID=232537 RepID=UPI001561E9D8|nr:hypothetical protein [Rhodoluna limnophila]